MTDNEIIRLANSYPLERKPIMVLIAVVPIELNIVALNTIANHTGDIMEIVNRDVLCIMYVELPACDIEELITELRIAGEGRILLKLEFYRYGVRKNE